jgi:hypothetical protein
MKDEQFRRRALEIEGYLELVLGPGIDWIVVTGRSDKGGQVYGRIYGNRALAMLNRATDKIRVEIALRPERVKRESRKRRKKTQPLQMEFGLEG